jgi:hypothetical protein
MVGPISGSQSGSKALKKSDSIETLVKKVAEAFQQNKTTVKISELDIRLKPLETFEAVCKKAKQSLEKDYEGVDMQITIPPSALNDYPEHVCTFILNKKS